MMAMDMRPRRESHGEDYRPQHYHRLAEIMSQDKDLAIFRRFDEINILCLLALQSKILDLEYDFKSQCLNDQQSGLAEEIQYSQSFSKMRSSEPQRGEREDNQSNAKDKAQLDMLLELESNMSKYSGL
jgi:hypothetical protein